MTPECAEAHIDLVGLHKRLKGRSLGASLPTEEADRRMPWAYQFANPNGRPYHDDHGVPPLTWVRRMDTSYALPLPMRLVWSSGPVEPRWMPWQEDYPGGLSPGAEVRAAIPGSQVWDSRNLRAVEIEREVLAYDPVLPVGQSALFAAWLDDEWVPAFYTSTSEVLGRRLHFNYGVKPDMTWGDLMCNWPEASLTLTEIK